MDDSFDMEEVEPSKQMEEIVRCYNGIVEILQRLPGGDGDYIVGRKYMGEAAACIEKNPSKALRLMRTAQETIVAESRVVAELQQARSRRHCIPDYMASKREVEMEAEIELLRQKQSWKRAFALTEKLEELVRARAIDAVDLGTQLMIEDRLLLMNRPTTVNLIIANGSAFAMRIVSMTGAPEKQVSIFNEYRRSIAPGGQLTVRMNVTGIVEGDMMVEVRAEVMTEGRTTSLIKQASLRVEAAPVAPREVQGVAYGARQGGMPLPIGDWPPTPNGRDDLLAMTLDASAQDWVDLLIHCQRSSMPLDLNGLATIKDHELKKGYCSLLQAIIALPYDQAMDWTLWFEENDKGDRRGIVGDDFTRRVAPLLFSMSSSKERSVEFVNDGGVSSSNKEKFTTALHIASGIIGLPSERRKEVRSWDFLVVLANGEVKVSVEKTVIKDEAGRNLQTIFRRVR